MTDSSTAAKIKSARIEAELTQERLAALAGVPLSTLRKIEQGKTDPRHSTIRAIWSALDLHDESLAASSAAQR